MNLYILNTLLFGVDTIEDLRRDFKIAGIIGLEQQPSSVPISGYVSMEGYCRNHNIDWVGLESYSMSAQADRARLLELEIDLLLVCGWQRLVPDWLIRHVRKHVVGAHGSTRGITGGRGRSPQNWAILFGHNEFHISIFKIDAGIDSGPIIKTSSFEIDEFDDIRTSYCKSNLLIAKMIREWILEGMPSHRFHVQSEDARYLPQRLPEDGEIDWNRSSIDIYNFIRALTKPYPGAFSRFGSEKIAFWRVRPFKGDIPGDSYCPGEIVRVFEDGSFLVKTADSCIFVDDYDVSEREGHSPLLVGERFESCDFGDQMNRIAERHSQKYPDLALSEDILNACGRV